MQQQWDWQPAARPCGCSGGQEPEPRDLGSHRRRSEHWQSGGWCEGPRRWRADTRGGHM